MYIHAGFRVQYPQLQRPLFEPFQNNTRCFSFLAGQRVRRITVRKRARPVVLQISVVVMHHHVIPAIPRHLPLSTAEIRSLISGDVKAISCRPTIDIGHNVCSVCIPASVLTSEVGNRSVVETMELHDRNRLSAWLTLRQLLVAVKVEGSRYRRESSNSLRHFWVASKQASEASAIRLSGCVDARSVDAKGGFEVVQKLECKCDIVD